MSEIHSKAKGFQNQYKQAQWYWNQDVFGPMFLYLNDSSTLWYYKFNIKLNKIQTTVLLLSTFWLEISFDSDYAVDPH